MGFIFCLEMPSIKKSWPADKVSRRPVADLVPYARNARTHSAEQVDQIAESIKEWGWTVPVLIEPNGGIIAGHGRILAAQKLGIETVPCMVAEGWTEAQRRAYVIADNKLTLNGGWDRGALSAELEEIGDAGFDLALTGFGEDEISKLLNLSEDIEVEEIETSTVNDRFWIGIRGPLEQQAAALDALKAALEGVEGVEVEVNTYGAL